MTYKLLRSDHEIDLIHLGFDPDKAEWAQHYDLGRLVKEDIFNKIDSSILVINNGGMLRIEELDPISKRHTFKQRFDGFPPFGIFNRSTKDEHALVFCVLDNEEGTRGSVYIPTTNSVVYHNPTESNLLSLFIDRGHYEIAIWGKDDDEHHSEVVLPRLPLEERARKYWERVAKLANLDLSKPLEDSEQMQYYEIAQPNDSLAKLVLKSTKGSNYDLIVEAEFGNRRKFSEFEKFMKFAVGGGSIHLDGKFREAHEKDFEGTKLRAEYNHQYHHLATKLIMYLTGN